MSFNQLFKLSPGAIAEAFKKGERIGSQEGFKLLASAASSTHFIIALTRTIKGSVTRNLIRRRIKAALQCYIKNSGPLTEGTFLCVVYAQALSTSYQDIESWLTRTLNRYRKAHTQKSSL